MTTPQDRDPAEVEPDADLENAPPVNPAYSTPPGDGLPDAETPQKG